MVPTLTRVSGLEHRRHSTWQPSVTSSPPPSLRAVGAHRLPDESKDHQLEVGLEVLPADPGASCPPILLVNLRHGAGEKSNFSFLHSLLATCILAPSTSRGTCEVNPNDHHTTAGNMSRSERRNVHGRTSDGSCNDVQVQQDGLDHLGCSLSSSLMSGLLVARS